MIGPCSELRRWLERDGVSVYIEGETLKAPTGLFLAEALNGLNWGSHGDICYSLRPIVQQGVVISCN